MTTSNFPIKVSSNGKHVFIEWPTPVDFKTSFKIKAKKTVSSTTKMDSIVVAYRKKAT